MKITLLGTGLMGRPMAERLLQAKHEVTVYNRTREKAEPLRELGARVAATPQEAVEASVCTILMVVNATAIGELLFPPEHAPQLAGRTVIQMGTIAPEESVAFLRQVTAQGGEYFECPVLGSIGEAATGSLQLMVGGTEMQFCHWQEVLRCFGPKPVHIGAVGKAAALKLALNQLIAGQAATFALSLGLVLRSGVEVEQFMHILRQSALYCPAFDKKLARYLERDYTKPNFPAKHLLKDVRLFLEVAQAQHLGTAALEGIAALLEDTLQRDFGAGDYSAIFEAINPRQ